MFDTLHHLNYIAVLVVALAGFLFGWLWYSPLLFSKAWMTEMKFTKESMDASKPMFAKLMSCSIIYTLFSSFGLAVLISFHRSSNALHGALFGFFIGAFVVATRMLNGSLWEMKSCKLQAIVIGHELVLFTLQGAAFGVWR